MQNNRPDGGQSHKDLEDEMSRFEEEISGHTVDRPIIGTNTFRQASQTIHDVHHPGPEAHSNNFGHFHNQDPQSMQGVHSQGAPPGSMQPMGGPHMGGPPMGGPHMGGPPMGGPPRGGLPRGGPPRGGPPRGGPSRHGHMRGGPPRGGPPRGGPSMSTEMAGQNMPMDNMTYHQPANPQFPPQQVPFPMPPMPPQIPPQFHSGMQQGVQNVMPGMVPVGMVPVQAPAAPKAQPEHAGITPEQKKEWESAYARPSEVGGGKAKKKDKKFVRVAGGVVWEDSSLADWDPNDFRIFVGDLGNEVTDENLTRAFAKYPSFQKAKVVREKKTNKTKGYGFVSFKDSADFIKAMREMNGKYVGNRPIKLRKSTWKDRSVDVVKKKVKEKKKLGLR